MGESGGDTGQTNSAVYGTGDVFMQKHPGIHCFNRGASLITN